MKSTTTNRTAKNSTDNAPDIVTTRDLFGNVVYCDPATGKMRNRPTKSAQESAAAIVRALTADERKPQTIAAQPIEYQPTTCTALMVIDQRAARIRAAHTRHTLPSYAPIQASASHAADLYTMAHAAAAVCLRARDHASGQRLIADLRRMWGNDHRWSAAEDMTTTADIYRATAASQREEAHAAQAEADKLTRRAAAVLTSEHDRKTLLTAAAKLATAAASMNRKAAENVKAAQDIEKQLQELTASDRENIVHAAIVALLEFEKAERDTDPEEGENPLFRAACTAAGRTIDSLRAAKAGGYRTKVQRMGNKYGEGGRVSYTATAAENAAAYDAWCKQYPSADRVPFNVRGGLSAGYYTAEYRNTPRFPDGYYLVSHYVTEAPADLDTAADLTRAKAAAVDIRAISADLTARQRTALYLMAYATGSARPTPSKDPSRNRNAAKAIAAVIRAGDTAAAEMDADTASRAAAAKNDKRRAEIVRRADKRRPAVIRAAMLDKALTIAGIPAGQLAKQRAALRDRLERAFTTSPDTTSKAPAQPDVLKMWSEAAKATEDSRHPYPGHVATIHATSTTTGRTAALDVVWSTRYDPSKADTITAAQAEQEQAQATAAELAHQQTHAATAAALAYRRQLSNHTPSRTAYAAHDAEAAAAVFMLYATPAELDTVGRALLDERAAAKAAEQHSREIIRAAQRVTLDAWRKMTKAERAAFVEMLNS